MNNIFKSALRPSVLKRLCPLKNVITISCQQRQITRNLWYMCSTRNESLTKSIGIKLQHPTELCSCGCGKKGVHSKGKNEVPIYNYLLTDVIFTSRK